MQIDFSNLQAGFTLPDDTLCRGQIFQFMDASSGALDWVWDFGNGNLSTNQDPLTFFSAGGTYQVSLEVSDGICTSVASQVVFVDVCVGGIEPESVELDLFPVPARERLWLKVEGVSPGRTTIRIRDLLGRAVLERDWTLGNGNNVVQLDLEGLSTGHMVLELERGGVKWTKPFIVGE